MEKILHDDYISEICKYGEVYVVGGAIRNYLYNFFHNSNKKIKDYDYLVRFVSPDNLTKILSKFGTVKEVGKSFGILLFTPKKCSESYEFALPRTEISTENGYKDFIVTPDHNLPLKEDFSRRDATMNAIGFRIYSLDDCKKLDIDLCKTPVMDDFIDPFEGISDIKNKIWRCVGDPKKRFVEDPTRIMRAFRQSSELGLTIESETLKSISKNYMVMEQLIPLSYVRLFTELVKIIDSDTKNHSNYISLMNKLGILKFLGIENFQYVDDTDRFDSSFELSKAVKLALLIRPDEATDNIKKWIDHRQLSAVASVQILDVNTLITIQKYWKDVINIKSRYDMLKIKQNVNDVLHWNDHEIFLGMFQYLRVNNRIDNETYINILELYKQTSSYIFCTDQLKINGNMLMDMWKVNGKNIKLVKEHLLDQIFKDLLVNDFDVLIEYLGDNINKIIKS
jgi:tRNA nucleotidyltransferase/poly(A) polymerase